MNCFDCKKAKATYLIRRRDRSMDFQLCVACMKKAEADCDRRHVRYETTVLESWEEYCERGEFEREER